MQHFADVLRHLGGLVSFELLGNEVAAFLVRKAVPDAIARIDNELVIFGTIHDLDVWLARDCLVLCTQLRHVLVLEVADGSAESEVAVDALVTDEMVRRIDAFFFIDVAGLVVLRKFYDYATFLDEDGATISRVCAENLLLGDEYDAAGAAGVVCEVFLRNLLIDSRESLVECALEVHLLPLARCG